MQAETPKRVVRCSEGQQAVQICFGETCHTAQNSQFQPDSFCLWASGLKTKVQPECLTLAYKEDIVRNVNPQISAFFSSFVRLHIAHLKLY